MVKASRSEQDERRFGAPLVEAIGSVVEIGEQRLRASAERMDAPRAGQASPRMDLARGNRVSDLRHAPGVELAALFLLGEPRSKRCEITVESGLDGTRGRARSDEERNEDGPLHG
jgi:hypothetical protein